MNTCSVCQKEIDIDFPTYYWTECWVCEKFLCHDCIDKDETKIHIGKDIISFGWYIADDAFENTFCDDCFNVTSFQRRNQKIFN